MAGLSDLKVKESEVTPWAMHKVVMRAGNPSLEELDWAIRVICPEMRAPTFMSIFITNPYTNLALSKFRSEVCDVGARLK